MFRHLIFGIFLSAIVLGALIAGHALIAPPGLSKLIGFGLSAAGVTAAWLLFPNFSQKTTWMLILLVGITCRLAIFEMPPSTDINRYIWEGKMVSQGVSPYRMPAEQVSPQFHDQWWQNINHRDKYTAYPPIALALFAGLATISESITLFKSAFILFDLLILGLLFLLLKHARKPAKHAVLYAFNPVVLFAFAGEAHYDSIFVFFTVLTLLCFEYRKFSWMWISLALAINIKIIAVILLPWLLVNAPKRQWWVFLLTITIPLFFFWSDLPNLLTGIKEFGFETSFNSPIHSLLTLITNSAEFASCVCFSAFALILVYACYRYQNSMLACSFIFTGFILCSSIIHYWYLIWAFPFVILTLRLAWFWLWSSSGLYFLTSYSVDTGGPWELPPWAIVVQWLPFVALLFFKRPRIDSTKNTAHTRLN